MGIIRLDSIRPPHVPPSARQAIRRALELRPIDEEALAYLLESLTNGRLAIVTRRLSLLPGAWSFSGLATILEAAFLHAHPAGGRFTDGRPAVWYASFEVDTAIADAVPSQHQASPPVGRRVRERPFRTSCPGLELLNVR